MNQYIWLYKNLNQYQYLTDKAKKLYEEYKAITVTDNNQVGQTDLAKLKNCYSRFLEMFNNNPYDYKNGLKESEIEAKELDCYFVEIPDGLVPLGYYKEKHPVECVFLLNEKIDKQQKETQDLKTKVFESIEKETSKIDIAVSKLEKVKTSGYIRAIIATIAWMALLRYCVKFFDITNFFTIIKSIGDSNRFAEAVNVGMLNMPIFPNSGVVGWVVFCIIHIALIVVFCCNVKSIKREYELTYHKHITKKVYKQSKAVVLAANAQFDQNMKSDTQRMRTLAMKGMSETFEKNNVACLIAKIRKKIKIAKEYLKIHTTELRGIETNKKIVVPIIMVVCLSFTHIVIPNETFKTMVNTKIYEWKVERDAKSLRGKKLVQLNAENCPIYEKSSADSNVKKTLPIGTVVELWEKEIINEESWSEVQIITDTEFITGWVPTALTVPYNYADYNLYEEVGITESTTSSNLVSDTTEYYPWLAYDGNRETYWQDGNRYDTGVGEYLTFYFAEPTVVSMIQMFPGCGKSEEDYWKNERVKTLEIQFSDGESVVYEFDDSFTEQLQTIWLNQPVETEYITIEVLEVYEGSEFMDLPISEVHIFKARQ